MNVDTRAIETLLKLQKVDIEVMKAVKQRDELPQRAKLEALEAKRLELDAKRSKVLELQQKAQSDLNKVEVEDTTLADKQRRAQDLIDAAGSDYRSIESHSKELSGFAKRRDTLSEQIEALSAQLSKINGLMAQVDKGLEIIDNEVSAISADLAQVDGALGEQIDTLKGERDGLVGQLDADVVKLYEKTAVKTGGVALGKLKGDTCGVCRSIIEGGRLIELKASAPLGVCPSCKRLLVIVEEEAE